MTAPTEIVPAPPRTSRLRRSARRVLVALVVVYTIIGALLYFYQDTLIFPGTRFHGTRDARIQPVGDEQLLSLAIPGPGGGTISAVYLRALSAADRRTLPDADSRPMLVYFYGNGECASFNVDGSRAYRRMGYNVLIPDYPGFGLSPGHASGANLYRTADACYAYLTQTRHVPPGRIGVIGRSLGGAPAIYLASSHPLGACATLSAFRSLSEISASTVRHLFPTSLLVRHRLDNLSRMKDVRCPVFIAHGTVDDLIPFDSAADLAAAAHAATILYPVQGAGHNDIYDVGGRSLVTAIGEFLNKSFDTRAPGPTPPSTPPASRP